MDQEHTPDFAYLLANYRRRLDEITPPKTKAEIYETDMLKHDISRLEILARKQSQRTPRQTV